MLFELRNLDLRYPDGTLGVIGVSAKIRKGERIAIIGPNGSGKSTLLSAFNGWGERVFGTVHFEGRLLDEKALANPFFQLEFRSRVGYLSQNSDPIPHWPNEKWREQAKPILTALKIHHLAVRPPIRLSAGEKRKLELASLLAINPEVLLLDEPFAGLDPGSRQWLAQNLRERQEMGTTVIVATTDIDWKPNPSDRAIVLSERRECLGTFNVVSLLAELALLNEVNLPFDARNALEFVN